MNIIDKEPVLRAKKALKDFDGSLDVIELKTSARTAIDAANSLNCEIGAIVKSLLFKTEKTSDELNAIKSILDTQTASYDPSEM